MCDPLMPPDFQLLFEASPHPYLILRPDAAFTIVAVNERYLAATGTQRSAIVGHGVFEIFPDNPDDRSGSGVSDLRTSLNRVMADRHPDVMGVQKYDIPRRDGSGEFEVRYWSPVNAPVFGPTGDLLFIIHHVEDITEFILFRERASPESADRLHEVKAKAERLEAEVLRRAGELKEANRALKSAQEKLERRTDEQLHQSEARYRALVQASSQVLYRMSPDWSEMQQLQGGDFLADTEKPNRNWLQDYIHPDDQPSVLEKIAEAVQSEAVFEFEHRVRRVDGTLGWTHSRAVPVRNGAGEIVEWFGAASDITAKKEAEAALLRINADLEQRVADRTRELSTVNKELEGFTFAASHDLRGPLGRINSFSTLLEQQYRDRLEGSGLLYLDFIRQNATRLVLLVDDLLSHARIAQQHFDLQSIDIGQAVATVVQEQATDIRESRADVQVMLPAAQVLADRGAFGQALGNLVENALKYAARVSAPRIEIGGESRGDHYLLWVRDNGIGFDMKYHDRIFEMFRRLHTYNDYEGSGVGLALVKRAVERMGGRVWAESQPGQGSTFFLELQTAT